VSCSLALLCVRCSACFGELSSLLKVYCFPPVSAFGQQLSRYRLSTYNRRAFSVAGPTVWNSLLEDMRDPECSVDSYRQSLKTFLFLQY